MLTFDNEFASDGAGGVWVASFGQGLAHLDGSTLLSTYFDRARELPQNRVTALVHLAAVCGRFASQGIALTNDRRSRQTTRL
jgi:hypothetical protein